MNRGIGAIVGNRGHVHLDLGEFDDALACYAEQEKISRELGDRLAIVHAVGSRGTVHWIRGQYDEAYACFAEDERIARELGNRQEIAQAVGNRGKIHNGRTEYAEALECYLEQEKIPRALGDRRGTSYAVGGRGQVYLAQGQYEGALACLVEQEQIAREIGDRQNIAFAILNRGIVHECRGELETAIACYREQEKIAGEIGDRRCAAYAVGRQGVVHAARGEHAEALACFQKGYTEHHTLNIVDGLIDWLVGTVRVLLDLVEENGRTLPHGTTCGPGSSTCMPEYLPTYVPDATPETWRAMSLQRARECAEESITLSLELSRADTIFTVQVLLARIEAEEGAVESAVATLHQMLAKVTDDAERAELHFWLWKFGEDDDSRSRALQFYQALVASFQSR